MDGTIISALISGICVIIGAIISPIITHKLNNFSKTHNVSQNNIRVNKITDNYINKKRTFFKCSF